MEYGIRNKGMPSVCGPPQAARNCKVLCWQAPNEQLTLCQRGISRAHAFRLVTRQSVVVSKKKQKQKKRGSKVHRLPTPNEQLRQTTQPRHVAQSQKKKKKKRGHAKKKPRGRAVSPTRHRQRRVAAKIITKQKPRVQSAAMVGVAQAVEVASGGSRSEGASHGFCHVAWKQKKNNKKTQLRE